MRRAKQQRCLLVLFGLVVCIAFIELSINQYWHHYPGLFYFDWDLFQFVIVLCLIYIGLKAQFPQLYPGQLLQFLRELTFFSSLVLLIVLGTCAVQYTPFHPIDKKIVAVEHFFHIDIAGAIAWLNGSVTLRYIVNTCYDSVGYQIMVFPILIMILKKYDELYLFYFTILGTWILGSLLYYFFPTTAPASVINSPFFIEEQYNTGLKFWQLHHYIQPISAMGGMISMPSFHVIWGWSATRLLKPWKIPYCLLFAINSVMTIGCVMLGWHYFLDILGSFITLFLTHRLAKKMGFCTTAGSGVLTEA